MEKWKVYALMIMATVFWGGTFIAAKFATSFFPAFTLTFLRFSAATLILYIFLRLKDGAVYKLKKKDIPVFLFTGIVGMFGYHVLLFIALKYTTAINTSLINASSPMVTAILCILFLKEKVSFKKALAILISFTGVALTITGADTSVLSSFSLNRGDLLMMAAVVLWAFYMIYSRKVTTIYSPSTLTLYSFLFCSIFLIPFVAFENPLSFMAGIPWYAYAAVMYMSIFASVFGILAQQVAIKEIGPSKAAIFTNLSPPIAIGLSVVLLGETATVFTLFTAAMIIAGVITYQRS